MSGSFWDCNKLHIAAEFGCPDSLRGLAPHLEEPVGWQPDSVVVADIGYQYSWQQTAQPALDTLAVDSSGCNLTMGRRTVAALRERTAASTERPMEWPLRSRLPEQ